MAKPTKRKIPPPEPPPRVPWRDWVLLLVGAALIAVSALVANHYDLSRNLQMDFKGVRVQGTIEPWPGANGVRLSYKHPSGTLYAMLYRKPVRWAGRGRAPIELVYLPTKPETFQPAGLSYLPGAGALTLFLLGLTGVLSARHRLLQRLRTRVNLPPATPKR